MSAGGEPSEQATRENRSDSLRQLCRDIITLHKRYFGRGATSATAFWVHRDLVMVELTQIFTTVERTLIEKGQRDAVREGRQTFHSVMRSEFASCAEETLGRNVESYETVAFAAPDRLLEIFYLEPAAGPKASENGDSVWTA